MKNNKKVSTRSGFSLIELLCAVAIIMTIATVLITTFSGVSEATKEANICAQVRSVVVELNAARAVGVQLNLPPDTSGWQLVRLYERGIITPSGIKFGGNPLSEGLEVAKRLHYSYSQEVVSSN